MLPEEVVRKPTLIIMCGYPYAGKTTLARILEKELGFSRITIDEIIVELRFPLGEELSEETWTLIYTEAEKRLIAMLTSGLSVIFDATNGYKDYRDKLRSISKPLVGKILVIFVAAEFNTIRRRELNLVNRHKAVDVEETIQNFQIPTVDEISVTVKSDWSHQKILRLVKERLL